MLTKVDKLSSSRLHNVSNQNWKVGKTWEQGYNYLSLAAEHLLARSCSTQREGVWDTTADRIVVQYYCNPAMTLVR